VVDGLTGSLADDPDGLPAAIEAAGSLRPEDCRAHVARNFDLALMAGRYEDLYRDVVGVGTGRNSRRRRLPAVW
ncbi:MAG TPA: glycosyltransferase family 4 protein, partial [Micromonosporaceae bacterium]|nr:glycosyltransferase family 4 protein [Micromonosporaceae bacterium]